MLASMMMGGRGDGDERARRTQQFAWHIIGAALLFAGCDAELDDTGTAQGGGASVEAGGGEGLAGGAAGKRADSGTRAGVSDASAGADEVSCLGADCGGCPAPTRPGGVGTSVWSRDPLTGTCCGYAADIDAPDDRPVFQTLDECASSCRCSTVQGLGEETMGYVSERTTLECRCQDGQCPTTLEAARESLCASGRPVVRRQGCGLLQLADDGLFGNGWVFDQETRLLVGAYAFSDVVGALPCRAVDWVAGREFDCADAVQCHLCGAAPLAAMPPLCEAPDAG